MVIERQVLYEDTKFIRKRNTRCFMDIGKNSRSSSVACSGSFKSISDAA